MLIIKRIPDGEMQEYLCSLCGAEYNEEYDAFSCYENEKFVGICQFICADGTAYIKDLTRYDHIKNYKKSNHIVREGYDCFIERGTDGIYRVFCGSYTIEANAEARSAELGGDQYRIGNFVLEVKA